MPELRLAWQGGLNTSLHESRIAPDELADMENAIVRDGTVRLDQRYIEIARPDERHFLPQGLGFGKYGSGTASTQYCMIVSGQMFIVDPTRSPMSMVAVNGGGNLASGEWVFQQFENYIWFGNETAGLGRKLIGLDESESDLFGLIQLPTAPASAPTYFLLGGPAPPSWLGSSAATSPSFSASYLSAGDKYFLRLSTAGTYTLTVSFDTSPERRPDWSYSDIVKCQMQVPAGISVPTMNVLQGAQDTESIFWRQVESQLGFRDVYYRLHGIARSNRSAVDSLKFTFTKVADGDQNMTIVVPIGYGVWLSLDENANPGSGLPTLKELKYEYTYYNRDTGLESAPSPAVVIPASQQSSNGNWAQIVAPVSAESGVSDVRFYRRVEEGGSTTRYRLGSKQNSGTTVFWNDKLPLDEVRLLDIYTPSVLPGSGVTALVAWQNRMAIGAGPLLYISRDGEPLVYEPQSGAFDLADPARGLTLYVDDRRAEQIRGLVGEDALYIVTDFSVRAIFGSTPDNWRLIRLPGSEGAVGVRSWAPYKGGVLVLTPSGRLLFHHVALGEPQEVSGKLRARIGSEGMRSLASEDALVAVRPDGEIEVRSSDAYLIMDTLGNWRKGTHQHGAHSAMYVSGYPVRWLGTNGVFYQGGDDSYVSDGGADGATGTPALWSITTRKHLISRAGVSRVFWGDSAETLTTGPEGGQAVYPSIEILGERGTRTSTKRRGKKIAKSSVLSSGEALQFVIRGDKDTVVEECRLELEPLSPGGNR